MEPNKLSIQELKSKLEHLIMVKVVDAVENDKMSSNNLVSLLNHVMAKQKPLEMILQSEDDSPGFMFIIPDPEEEEEDV